MKRLLWFDNAIQWGGVQVHLVALIKAMSKADPELLLHLACDPSQVEAYRKNLGKVRMKIHPVHYRNPTSWKQVVRFAKLVRRIRPDVMHSHLYYATRLGAPVAKCMGVKRIVETIHIEETWRVGLNRMWHKVDGWIAKFCVAGHIAVSQAVAKASIRDKKLKPTRVTVIHNAVEPGVPSLGDGPDDMLGFLGRLELQKGVDILIEALGILAWKGIRPRVRLAGTGSEMAGLKTRALDLGILNQLEFLGHIDDRRAFFESIGTLVLPSRFEGFPLVVLESGTFGRPVIATSVSGTPEIVLDGKTGLLVPADNATALADAITRMVKDRALRLRLREGLMELVDREFSMDRMVARTTKVLAG